jgi:hypothetical protein
LFLYLLNRKGKEYVLFFLICLAISVRYSLEAGGPLQTLLPGGLNISNANAHTDGGEISVRAEDKGDSIGITVRDNGTGVTPELRAHVFERGVSDGGTGLGCFWARKPTRNCSRSLSRSGENCSLEMSESVG